VSIEDGVAIDLTDEERDVLMRGLSEWGGPAHCTEALAVAMGFAGLEGFRVERRRLSDALTAGLPLSRRDWRRTLIATEIVFASDVFGSGVEWSTTTGLTDEETIVILRSLQYKLAELARIHTA
jgi:hypothetical protein